MRILMMSNTYAPVIGGIEESIRSFSEELRRHGHRVVIVAPEFEGTEKNEKDIVRVPAVQNVLRHDFSVTLPVPVFLSRLMREFQPEIIHSHHFFLVGDMALRLARQHHVPLVFTHHIMLDQYAQFLPIHHEKFKRFVLKLATGYANLADGVIAPSRFVYELLRRAGVVRPMHIIPTGVNAGSFAKGSGQRCRDQWGIPPDAFVIGCVCRLTPEKNLEFLARAACRFLKRNDQVHCLIVGDGPLKERIRDIFRGSGVVDRLHGTGTLQGQDRIDAYQAMDLFIFSSHSETQGLVLLEAMAAGTPVAALDAPAVREVIRDFQNGRLVSVEDEEEFASVLAWFTQLSETERRRMEVHARRTADEFSIERCSRRLLDVYEELRFRNASSEKTNNIWDLVKDSLAVEKDLLRNAVAATEAAFKEKTARGVP